MSHAVVIVATPSILPAGIGLGAASALAGAAALACYGSYVAIRQLQQDYQNSLAVFRARSEAQAEQELAFAQQETAATNAALTIMARTKMGATEDATQRFLLRRVELLQERLPKLPTPDPDMAAQCAALMQAIADFPAEMTAHLEQYRRLSEQVTALIGTAKAGALKGALAEELAALREEIQSPLLDEEACAEVRAQLLQQIDVLETLAARQPSVAGQSLALLRQRLHRELRQQAVRRETRMREAADYRTLVGEAAAKLQALARVQELPEFAARATEMLGQLSDIVAHATADALPTIQRFAAEVDALFATCEQTLTEQTRAEYLGDEITGVLLSMGYRVSQIPGEESASSRAMIAAVDDQVGLQFHVNGAGLVGAEMVALSEDAVGAGQAAEERVCTLVDDVIQALNARQCGIRERFRSSLSPHEQLRVVQMPAAEQPALQLAEAPKQMRIEQP